MSVFTADYAISGASGSTFELTTHRLLGIATRLTIVEVNVWGPANLHHQATFHPGTDLRDAAQILEIAAEQVSRLSCLIRLPIQDRFTNLTITLIRKPGWTLLDGQLYLANLADLASPAAGLKAIVYELARIAGELHAPLITVVNEDTSPRIDGTEIRKPELAAIFNHSLLPTLIPAAPHKEEYHIIWFIEPTAFFGDGMPDGQRMSAFIAACREGNLAKRFPYLDE